MRPPRSFTRLHYNAKSPGKLQVSVPPGTVIETDAEFAATLQANDGHFRVVADAPAEDAPTEETPAAGEDPAADAKPRKSARK